MLNIFEHTGLINNNQDMKMQDRLDELRNFIDSLPSEDEFVKYDENGDHFFTFVKSLCTVWEWNDTAQSKILHIILSEKFPKT
jgi:hypothetical protein